LRSTTRSVRVRRITVEGRYERLAWMIVIATIPVGLTGIALEHTFRTIFAKPVAAAVFLFINGLVLVAGERLRRRQVALVSTPAIGAQVGGVEPAQVQGREPAETGDAEAADGRIARLSYRDAFAIGALQIAALFAGISRSGSTIVGGLWRGLD